MLLLSMAVMSVAMLLTALLPTHAQIGPAAAWLLFGLRCVMGFSVGGEYTGVIAYLLEGSRPERRGLIASLAAAASEVGALLAVGVAALTVSLLSEAELQSWGWRIPFLVGAALAGTVWFARSTMEESPDFERLREAGTLALNPLAHAVSRQRRGAGARLRDLGARLDHLLRRHHLRARVPDLGRLDERGGFAVAVDHRGGRGDPGHAGRRAAVRPVRPQARAGRARPAQRRAADHAVLADGGRLGRTRRCSARWCWRWSRAGSARSARSPPASSSPRRAAPAGSGSATPWRRRSSAA